VGENISIDYCTAGAQQQRRAAGECGQCHIISVRRKPNIELFRGRCELR